MSKPAKSLSEASYAYFTGRLRDLRHPDFVLPLSVGTEALIRSTREYVRRDNQGGGMCHEMTDWLSEVYGLARFAVTYVDPFGEVVCAGHYVCIMDDGTIVDPTADQMGEGHDIRILRPGDPEYGRYRPEFDLDFHPGHPDIDGVLDGWSDLPHTDDDHSRQDAVRRERGEGWWLEDHAALASYLEHQAELSSGSEYEVFVADRIRSLSSRSVSSPGL